MAARPSLETAGAAAALLLVVAFLVSFAIGLRSRGGTSTEAVREETVDMPPLQPAGRIEVLNASGRSGVARAATAQLRDGGFDVVFFGNASGGARDSSIVLARVADDAVARAAARRLGITRVQTQLDTTLYLDATIILGKDWRN